MVVAFHDEQLREFSFSRHSAMGMRSAPIVETAMDPPRGERVISPAFNLCWHRQEPSVRRQQRGAAPIVRFLDERIEFVFGAAEAVVVIPLSRRGAIDEDNISARWIRTTYPATAATAARQAQYGVSRRLHLQFDC